MKASLTFCKKQTQQASNIENIFFPYLVCLKDNCILWSGLFAEHKCCHWSPSFANCCDIFRWTAYFDYSTIFANFTVDLDGREAVDNVFCKALNSSAILLSIKMLNMIRGPVHNRFQLYDYSWWKWKSVKICPMPISIPEQISVKYFKSYILRVIKLASKMHNTFVGFLGWLV